MTTWSSIYFADGKKTIDFIVVYRNSSLVNHEKLDKFENFVDNLKLAGFLLEIDDFTQDSDLVFIKIHVPNDLIILYTDICDVDLASRTVAYRPIAKPPTNFMATILTKPDENDEVYKRAPESISGKAPKTITSAEKGMIIYKILSRMKYGPRLRDFGIQQLCKDNILSDFFILHEGGYAWTETGPLSDRQLLAKYWGNFKCWNKTQPMFLIEKYYGPEFAFYFAWLGHYCKMLIVPAAFSIIILIYGMASIYIEWDSRSKGICESQQILCPRCHYTKCRFERVKSTCVMSHLTRLFDNTASIIFAVFISIWSTVFMEVWQRTEAELQLQWNVREIAEDIVTRPEYIDRARKTKFSTVTLTHQPYIPAIDQCFSYVITTASILLLLLLVVGALIGVMIYRITVTLVLLKRSEKELIVKNRGTIASVSGATMSAIFIILFKKLFEKLSFWLTTIENHRTQNDFDNAYIFKAYGLAFVNNYAAVLYIAFFKGKFFSHPGDMVVWEEFGGLGSDICDINGCIVDLGIQLLTIMTVKAVVSHGSQNLLPILGNKLKFCRAVPTRTADLTFYEEEYFKQPVGPYFLLEEYQDMVIQYGFVVFFVAGFPLAPLLAFINNVFELRTDASKITKSFRRPIAKKASGLGAWFGILQAITYAGVVCNAFVIAFTSMFVELTVFKYRGGHAGFHNFTLSAYDIDEFYFLKGRGLLDQKWCYYSGMRYPPNHPNKYELTPDFWFILTLRFFVVIIFEHLVIFIKGLVAYAIPDVPDTVLEQLAKEKNTTIT